MPRVEIRNPIYGNAFDLVANFSEENEREAPALKAECGMGPVHSVLSSLKDSEWSQAVFFDGRLALVVGVARRSWGGQLWLVTSREAEKFPLALYKYFRSLVPFLGQQYGSLMNVAHAGNVRSIAMFKRLGCEVVDSGLEVGGEKFVHITWEAPCV